MSTDTMLGDRKRDREIDWKRVADSYRDDLCALILAGNALKRCLRASVNAAEVAHAIEQWDDWLRIVTPEPICVHSTSPGEGVPAPEQTGALLSSEGPSAPGSPASIKRGGPITTENHPWRK